MKLLLYSLLLLFAFVHVSAQQKNANIKMWKEGKLEWSDFTEKESSGIITSGLEHFIKYEEVKEKSKDTVFFLREIRSFMDRDLSWVYKQAKNSNTLKYNQVQFDIGEYNARLFRKDAISKTSEWVMREALENHVSLSSEMISTMQHETNWGTDYAKVLEWETKMSQLLKSNPRNKIPKTKVKDFGTAFHYSLGASALSGSIANYFSNRFSLAFGFDLSYQQTLFLCNFYINGVTCNKDYNNSIVWKSGERTSISVFDFSLGQTILDGRKIKITPTIGYGISSLDEAYKKEKEKQEYYGSSNFVYGLNIDYKLRKKYKFYQSIWHGKMRYSESLLRFRAQLTKVDFAPELSGNMINFSIGFASFSKRLIIDEK